MNLLRWVDKLETDRRWLAKLVLKDPAHPVVDIRCTTANGVQLKVIVSLDGVLPGKYRSYGFQEKDMYGANVRMSMNGTAHLTFSDFQDLNRAVDEATEALLFHTGSGEPMKYYYIISGYKGDVMGACTSGGVEDVRAEEPGAKFQEITKAQYEQFVREQEQE